MRKSSDEPGNLAPLSCRKDLKCGNTINKMIRPRITRIRADKYGRDEVAHPRVSAVIPFSNPDYWRLQDQIHAMATIHKPEDLEQ